MKDNVFDKISSILRELGAATTKTAELADEPETEHPSKDVEDSGNLNPAPEGSHYEENAEDASDAGSNVDDLPEMTYENAPRQEDNDPSGGCATGEGEKITPQDRPTDSPTDSPVNVNIGEKYSSDHALATASLSELLKAATALGNAIAADLAAGNVEFLYDNSITQKSAEANSNDEAVYSEIASDVVETIISDAEKRADLTAQYLYERYAHLSGIEKGGQWADVAMTPEEEAAAQSILAAMGAPPAAVPVDNTMAAPMPEDLAAQQLISDTSSEAENDEDEEEGEEDDEKKERENEELLEELISALQELGENDESLAENGGEEGEKIAAAVRQYRLSGKYRIREAKAGSARRRLRDHMKDYIRDLYARNGKL